MEDASKFPAWKEAVEKFTFSYGDIVPHEWFYSAFNISKPNDGMSFKDSKKSQFDFMANFKRLESYLLEEKQMALRNIRNKGWEVILPEEQTEWALDSGVSEMKKALRKMYSRQINVNYTLLSSEQKKENTDSLAKTSMLRGMITKFGNKQLTVE